MTTNELQLIQGPIYRESVLYAFQLTKNMETAKDLAQEASYLAHKRRHTFQSGSNLRNWMRTITFNTFVNGYRKTKRRRELISARPPVDNWMVNRTTDNDGQHQLNADDLMAVVEALPRLYRQPFMMHYRGITYQAMSLRLRVPIGTIKSRVFTARQLMKKMIGERYGRETLAAYE